LDNRKKQGAFTDYFVKCDASLNTPYVIEQGQTLAQVGIAPIRPTEFFIITITQMQSGGSATIA
jgi:hypothetical protein